MTKAVFAAVQDLIAKTKEDLADTAGLEPLYDRFRAGAIAAYMDLLRIEFDEVSHGN